MKRIKQVTQHIRGMVFSRLDAPRRNYEKTMINNMDGLYRVIQKGDVILVEGDSHISRMIKLFTQSSWSHSALYVGDEILVEGADHREAVINRFGKDDAHHMIVEAFTGTGVTAEPIRKYQDFNISPNFQIIKFNIIEGGEFNYKTLWAQTIFETRHSKGSQTTQRKDPAREPVPAQHYRSLQ